MPNLKLPERLVVDATSIVSALVGGKAVRIFSLAPAIQFLTTEYTINEARFWIDNEVARNGTDRHRPGRERRVLPLAVYTLESYQHRLDEAKKLIRDADDVELMALALEVKAPIWSNDNVFREAGVESYPTGRLLRVLWKRLPLTASSITIRPTASRISHPCAWTGCDSFLKTGHQRHPETPTRSSTQATCRGKILSSSRLLGHWMRGILTILTRRFTTVPKYLLATSGEAAKTAKI